MSRRRLAIRKHSTYKPDLKKIAAHRRASHKRLQRKKKRKKREAKAKRAKGFNKKGRNQKKKKKLPHARQMSRSFKFVRYHKGKNTVFYKNLNSSVIFGTWGFKLLKSSKINSKQLFAAKQLLIRIVRGRKKKTKNKRKKKSVRKKKKKYRRGRLRRKRHKRHRRRPRKNKKKKRLRARFWDYTLSDLPVTRKPDEIRMGKGKGQVKFWATRLAFGKIMFEFSRVRTSRVMRGFQKFGEFITKPFVVVRYVTKKWKKKFTSSN